VFEGFVLAKKVLYHLSHSSRPIAVLNKHFINVGGGGVRNSFNNCGTGTWILCEYKFMASQGRVGQSSPKV
jgi:hypothetical protein